MRKLIVTAGLLLLAPTLTHAKTLEELLVEKGVITKGEAAASGSSGGSWTWKSGNRVNYPSEGVTANIATQLQERYTFTDFDEDDTDNPSNTSSFDTRRARIIVSGTAMHEEFSYVLQTDFVGNDDTDAKSPELRDAYLKWAACDWADLKMGQFKTGISRQFNNSSAKLQFVDRSVASEYFDLGRQPGLAAETDVADGMLELSAAIFNGESDGEGQNQPGVDTNHTGVVTARWNAMGTINSHEEGDIDYTEDMAVSLGAAYAFSDAKNDIGAGLEETDKDTVSIDANMKVSGISVHGEYFFQNQDADSFEDSADVNGFYLQAGIFLDPKVLEVAARYSLVDCDDGAGAGDCAGLSKINAAAATINYYFWKHNLKAQFGYELINEDVEGATGDAEDINTNKWIFQLSAYL